MQFMLEQAAHMDDGLETILTTVPSANHRPFGVLATNIMFDVSVFSEIARGSQRNVAPQERDDVEPEQGVLF